MIIGQLVHYLQPGYDAQASTAERYQVFQHNLGFLSPAIGCDRSFGTTDTTGSHCARAANVRAILD